MCTFRSRALCAAWRRALAWTWGASMVGPRDGQPGAHERAREASRRLGILWHAQTWFYTRTLGQHMQCAVESLACSAWLKSRALSRARILVESKMLWQS